MSRMIKTEDGWVEITPSSLDYEELNNIPKLNGKNLTGNTVIKLSDLDEDSTHRLVTDTEKTTWNGKADSSSIPTQLSQLTEDSTHRLVTDTEKAQWNNSGGSTVSVTQTQISGTEIATITVDGTATKLYAPTSSSSGGSENSSVVGMSKTILFETDTYAENATLSQPYTNFDFIMLVGYILSSNNRYIHTNLFNTQDIKIGERIGLYNDDNYTWYNINSTTDISKVLGGNIKLFKILGFKYSDINNTPSNSSGGDGSSNASDISYDNSQTSISSTNVQDAIDEVFQSVSNGKELIADAITDKGIDTSATDTFSTMANNISLIIGEASQSVYDLGYVQDDTLALWLDGISNSIRELDEHHSEDGTKWTDKAGKCVGSGTSGLTWESNCLRQPRGQYMKFRHIAVSTITIEVVFELLDNSASVSSCVIDQQESGGYGIQASKSNSCIGASMYIDGSYRFLNIAETEINKQYFISATYDGSQMKGYINGQLVSTLDIEGTFKMPATSNYVCIGNSPAGSSMDTSSRYGANSKVYAVRIYTRPLTDTEIMNNYLIDKERFED